MIVELAAGIAVNAHQVTSVTVIMEGTTAHARGARTRIGVRGNDNYMEVPIPYDKVMARLKAANRRRPRWRSP